MKTYEFDTNKRTTRLGIQTQIDLACGSNELLVSANLLTAATSTNVKLVFSLAVQTTLKGDNAIFNSLLMAVDKQIFTNVDAKIFITEGIYNVLQHCKKISSRLLFQELLR